MCLYSVAHMQALTQTHYSDYLTWWTLSKSLFIVTLQEHYEPSGEDTITQGTI